MTRFVKVEWTNNFEAIREYILKDRQSNYYIAPKLMHMFLASLRVNCVAGVRADDIRIRQHHRIEFTAMPVYNNKVFQTNVFRVDAIKRYDTLTRLENEFENNDIVFGLDEDEGDFLDCSECETLD